MDAVREAGIDPALKLTASFADGASLHAEPFDRGGGAEWQAMPRGSFVTATKEGLSIGPFVPDAARLALAG